jgi:hypothetical protein
MITLCAKVAKPMEIILNLGDCILLHVLNQVHGFPSNAALFQ